jgi:hypothetical protein
MYMAGRATVPSTPLPRVEAMPKSGRGEDGKVEELLQKLLVLQMFSMGVPQEKIAKTVGRQRQWVTELLKGIPRKGE